MVLHEWHGPVNNPVTLLAPARQPAEIARDSPQVAVTDWRDDACKWRRRMVFVPFWRTSALDLTKRTWLNGHIHPCPFATLENRLADRRYQARWHQN